MSKTNPNRVPVSKAYADKRYQEGINYGLWSAWIIMFTALSESLGMDDDKLKNVFEECEYKAESIRKGYCKVEDWDEALQNEHDIHVGKNVLDSKRGDTK